MNENREAGGEGCQENGRVFYAEGSRVIGKVSIGENSSVWYNAVIRADLGDLTPVRIGRCTNIQDNAVIHVAHGYGVSIGDYVTIGHSAIIHGCEVGSHTLIGMGAIVLNGARIGKNCVIGAGTLITQGKQIPDGSVVFGTPATIRRAVTKKDLEETEYSAQYYLALAKDPQQQGRWA